MLVTADQLVAHAVGDYLLQSHYMATEKTKQSLAAAIHATVYGACFLLFRPSLVAFAFIVITHFVIDRWRLARFVVWAKNHLAPPKTVTVEYVESGTGAGGQVLFTEHIKPLFWWHPWSECSATGYHKDVPPWLSVWLLIAADNVMHVLLNAIALKYL
jgi:hypothetical protein